MLGVKRLAELRRGLLQGEAPGEGSRQLARGPELMAIEGLENGDGPAAAGPRLLTFQGSELSPELQAAMAGDGPEPLPLHATWSGDSQIFRGRSSFLFCSPSLDFSPCYRQHSSDLLTVLWLRAPSTLHPQQDSGLLCLPPAL